jgi:hypothetical protein
MWAKKKKIMGKQSPKPMPTHGFKGVIAASHFERWAHRVSEMFAHARTPTR